MGKKANNPPLRFFGGLSGLELPVPKYLFPHGHRDSSRLTYYATFFNSIEVNSTFYKLPLAKTIARWRNEVPEHFRFTFKLWKEITHVKHLAFKEPDVETFFRVIGEALYKKGCVLIQLPPASGLSDMMQLSALLSCVGRCNMNQGWKIAVEFRNRSWYQREVYELLEKHGAGLVIHDIPKSLTPMTDHGGDFIYLRFHGPAGNYRDSYTEQFLAEYSSYVSQWMDEGKTVFAYFNNTMGDAFKNMQTLNEFVSANR